MNEFHVALLWMVAMAVATIAVVGGGTMYAYVKGKSESAGSSDESRPSSPTEATDQDRARHDDRDGRELSKAA